LTFPALSSSALCSSYELQFPKTIWAGHKLPEQKLEGTYTCDASLCSLSFAPVSYALGIQLADAKGPWPDFEDTTPSHFTDDDEDGLPGVSIDVMSLASVSSGQGACDPAGGPTLRSEKVKFPIAIKAVTKSQAQARS
jgi:hypothetical protein